MNDEPRPPSALAALRVDSAPARELWPAIAARIADPEPRDQPELPAALAAGLRALREDRAPPPAVWEAIARRIEAAGDGEPEALPPGLQAGLAALPQAVAPARDLWPAIAARTIAPPVAPRRRPSRLAALAVAASLVAAVGLLVQTGGPPAGAGVGAGTGAGIARAPLRPSAEAYVATIGGRRADPELLRASYRPISPEARALMRANLKIVDSAETAIEQAMADDPDSAAELQALLDSAREQRRQLHDALDARP